MRNLSKGLLNFFFSEIVPSYVEFTNASSFIPLASCKYYGMKGTIKSEGMVRTESDFSDVKLDVRHLLVQKAAAQSYPVHGCLVEASNFLLVFSCSNSTEKN